MWTFLRTARLYRHFRLNPSPGFRARGMATADVMRQLQVWVLDLAQMVSYKWLSRNLSMSSNAAKRVLQEFAEQQGDSLKVVYAVSGWTRAQPSTYSIKLVQGAKLQEAKSLLVGDPSVHVYSVQVSLPKDPAQLWTADYIQAEELFSAPATESNCLRDNRFSGVSCSLVTRCLTANAQPEQSASSSTTGNKQDPPLPVNAPKAKHVAAGLSSHLWGRSKQQKDFLKQQVPSASPAPAPARDADTSIQAFEDVQAMSEGDDDAADFMMVRRGSGNKRRVVFEEDDDEEEILPPNPLREREADANTTAAAREPTKTAEPEPVPEPAAAKKKRKLLRTRIDERGREVMEVVWDTDGQEELQKVVGSHEPAVQQQASLQNPEDTSSNPRAKPASKPSNGKVPSKASTSKLGKGGKAGPQQGSIMSFFKKK